MCMNRYGESTDQRCSAEIEASACNCQNHQMTNCFHFCYHNRYPHRFHFPNHQCISGRNPQISIYSHQSFLLFRVVSCFFSTGVRGFFEMSEKGSKEGKNRVRFLSMEKQKREKIKGNPRETQKN